VNCNLTQDVLHGYLDGELDAAGAAEFERHLEGCNVCMAELEAQEALRASLKRAQLYEKAPTGLPKKFQAPTKVMEISEKRPGGEAWRWLGVAAALILLAYGTWRMAPGFVADGRETRLSAELVDEHIRSLQPGHLNDVVSTDRHTVKPWFDGKLDFAPDVRDFAEQGFPLQGGRLEVVEGRSVAALVYGRRKHTINLFLWPSTARGSEVESGARQGYNWVHWNNGNFEMWAISDVNSGDLQELRKLWQEAK
jgi:anti-sigma factor (TIGR02949 family)